MDVDVDSLAHCASSLSLQDLSNMAMSCKYLKRVAYSDSIWLRWFREHWPQQMPASSLQTSEVRDAYLARWTALQQFKFVDPSVTDFYSVSKPYNQIILDKNDIIFSQGSLIGIVKIDDLSSASCPLSTLSDHNARITSMRLFPLTETYLFRSDTQSKENVLVTSSCDHSIRLWWKGSCQRCFRGHSGPVSTLSDKLLGDGSSKVLASGGEDGTVRLWSLNSRGKRGQQALKATLHGHEKPVKLIAVSGHKTSLLVTMSNDSKVRVWDTTTSSAIRSSCCVGMASVPGAPLNMKCHESMLYVASGSSVNAIDLRTMQKVITAAIHPTKLYSCEILPSKALICTGGNEREDDSYKSKPTPFKPSSHWDSGRLRQMVSEQFRSQGVPVVLRRRYTRICLCSSAKRFDPTARRNEVFNPSILCRNEGYLQRRNEGYTKVSKPGCSSALVTHKETEKSWNQTLESFMATMQKWISGLDKGTLITLEEGLRKIGEEFRTEQRKCEVERERQFQEMLHQQEEEKFQEMLRQQEEEKFQEMLRQQEEEKFQEMQRQQKEENYRLIKEAFEEMEKASQINQETGETYPKKLDLSDWKTSLEVEIDLGGLDLPESEPSSKKAIESKVVGEHRDFIQKTKESEVPFHENSYSNYGSDLLGHHRKATDLMVVEIEESVKGVGSLGKDFLDGRSPLGCEIRHRGRPPEIDEEKGDVGVRRSHRAAALTSFEKKLPVSNSKCDFVTSSSKLKNKEIKMEEDEEETKRKSYKREEREEEKSRREEREEERFKRNLDHVEREEEMEKGALTALEKEFNRIGKWVCSESLKKEKIERSEDMKANTERGEGTRVVQVGPSAANFESFKMSWKIEVDSGFDYLVLLQFYELLCEVKNQRIFRIYINSKTAEIAQIHMELGLVEAGLKKLDPKSVDLPNREHSSEKACVALQALTFSKKNARAIVSCGGVSSLLEICQALTPDSQAIAAGVLRNLAVFIEIRENFIDENEFLASFISYGNSRHRDLNAPHGDSLKELLEEACLVRNLDLRKITECECWVVFESTTNVVATHRHVMGVLAKMVGKVDCAENPMKARKWQQNKFVEFSLVGKIVLAKVFKREGLEAGIIVHDRYVPKDPDKNGTIGAFSLIRAPYLCQWGIPTFDAGETFDVMDAFVVVLIRHSGVFSNNKLLTMFCLSVRWKKVKEKEESLVRLKCVWRISGDVDIARLVLDKMANKDLITKIPLVLSLGVAYGRLEFSPEFQKETKGRACAGSNTNQLEDGALIVEVAQDRCILKLISFRCSGDFNIVGGENLDRLELAFTDFKLLEYSLVGMLFSLQPIKPPLSKGNSMLYLFMGDLHVVRARNIGVLGEEFLGESHKIPKNIENEFTYTPRDHVLEKLLTDIVNHFFQLINLAGLRKEASYLKLIVLDGVVINYWRVSLKGWTLKTFDTQSHLSMADIKYSTRQ